MEGAAFQSRLPVDKLHADEAARFPDIEQGVAATQKLFLYIRNRLVKIIIYYYLFFNLMTDFTLVIIDTVDFSCSCGWKIQKWSSHLRMLYQNWSRPITGIYNSSRKMPRLSYEHISRTNDKSNFFFLDFRSSDANLVGRIHAFLQRHGFINFGVFKRITVLKI